MLRKYITGLGLAVGIMSYSQVGIDTDTPNPNTDLDLGATNRALYLNRVANTSAVHDPQLGMMVYDQSGECVRVYEGDPAAWSACLAGQMSLTCDSTSFSGPVFQNNPYSGTLTIPYTGGKGTAYPAQSFIVNGLTFTLPAGNFSNGAGNIVYNVSGTAPASGNSPVTITVGGQSCSVTLSVIATVTNPAGAVTSLTCASAAFSPASATQGTAYTGTLTIPYTGGNGGAYPAQNFMVNGLTFVLPAGNFNNGAGTVQFSITGTPATATAISGDITVGGQTCSLTFPVNSNGAGVLDPRIVLAQNRIHFIASVYDNDYLPYTAPTVLATLDRPVAADGINEAKLVDLQGSITTAGFQVQIPATVTGTGTNSIQAWTSTFVVPAAYTQDGNSRTLQLSWAAQSFTATTTYITATIKSIGGDLLAKKLDINAGIGSDYLGWLMGQFQYPYNAAGATTSYQVRDIPGIPDRMFGVADNSGSTTSHLMLYLPIQANDGKIWLNNNLGADYANLTKGVFNLTQQATSTADFNAYGSLFQWGRKGDGHELIAYTNGTTGRTALYSAVPGPLTEPLSTPNYIFNIGDWRSPAGNMTLWTSTGTGGTNNPCPYGFRVPSQTEQATLASVASALKFTVPGYRNNNSYFNPGTQGYYWNTTPSSDTSFANLNSATLSGNFGLNAGSIYRYMGTSIRCVAQ